MVKLLGLRPAPLLLRDHAQLVIGCGLAVAVVELDIEGEGLLVKLLGLGPAPLLLRDHAQLVIGSGLAVAVVELDLEGEGLLVKLLGLAPSAAALARPCPAGDRFAAWL